MNGNTTKNSKNPEIPKVNKTKKIYMYLNSSLYKLLFVNICNK